MARYKTIAAVLLELLSRAYKSKGVVKYMAVVSQICTEFRLFMASKGSYCCEQPLTACLPAARHPKSHEDDCDLVLITQIAAGG